MYYNARAADWFTIPAVRTMDSIGRWNDVGISVFTSATRLVHQPLVVIPRSRGICGILLSDHGAGVAKSFWI
jgi:hypothetical protein